MAGNPGAGRQPRKQPQPQQKKPASPKPEPGRPGCYRDPRTGKFVCPPGARPTAKPSRKPTTPAPAPTRKPPKGWFPMPDQRELLNRSNIAAKPRRGRSSRTA